MQFLTPRQKGLTLGISFLILIIGIVLYWRQPAPQTEPPINSPVAPSVPTDTSPLPPKQIAPENAPAIEAKFVRALREDRLKGEKSFVEIELKNFDEDSIKQKIKILASDSKDFKNPQAFEYAGAPVKVPISSQIGQLFIKADGVPAVKTIAYQDAYTLNAPTLEFPDQNQTHFRRADNPSPLLFSWSKDPRFRFYQLEISEKEDFSAARSFESDTNKFLLNVNLESGTYYWRVRTLNTFMQSPWSEARSFTIYREKTSP